MKITKQRLKEIIKEELAALSEANTLPRPTDGMVASAGRTRFVAQLTLGPDGYSRARGGRPWTDGYPSGEGALSPEDQEYSTQQKIDALIQRGNKLKMRPGVLLSVLMSMVYEYEEIIKE